MKINIKKHASCFHDGSIQQIKHVNNTIILTMESGELSPEWNEDHIELSKRNTVSGKLHISGVRIIKKNEVATAEIFQVLESYDRAHIHHFAIDSNNVILVIWWIKYPYEGSDTFLYEIEAESIEWENIPELSDEYWEILERESNDNEL